MPVQLDSAAATQFFSEKNASELTSTIIAAKKRNGLSSKAQGNLNQAITELTSARDLQTEKLGPNHPDTAHTNLLIAEVLNSSGRTDQSLLQYRSALAALDDPAKKSDKSIGDISIAQGYSYLGLGDFEKAKVSYDNAVKFRKSVYGERHIEVINAKDGLALAYQGLKQHPEALKLYGELLEAKIQNFGENNLSVAGTYNNMALILDTIGKPDEAIRMFDKALEIKYRLLGAVDIGIAATLKNRGNSLLKCWRLEEALVTFESAVKMEKIAFNDYHECIATSLKTIATILKLMGRTQESVAANQAALHVEQTVAIIRLGVQ